MLHIKALLGTLRAAAFEKNLDAVVTTLGSAFSDHEDRLVSIEKALDDLTELLREERKP